MKYKICFGKVLKMSKTFGLNLENIAQPQAKGVKPKRWGKSMPHMQQNCANLARIKCDEILHTHYSSCLMTAFSSIIIFKLEVNDPK